MEYFPCTPTPDCPYYKTTAGCHESIHHELYPANDYRGAVERTFRNLDQNKTDICRRLHDQIHATETPPDKPDFEEMRQAVITADQAGQIFLSAYKRRKVYGHDN